MGWEEGSILKKRMAKKFALLRKGLSYLSDSTEHLFLMRVHLCECPDLGQVDIFSITEGNNLIEGKDEVKAVLRYLTLLQDTTIFRNLKRN